jgi:hypothetical protein
VVGQGDSVQPTIAGALDQRIERGPAVVGVTRMQMKVDPHRARVARRY